jgi:tellurite resistance protein
MFLNRLNSILEILAAKRTPERAEKEQQPPQYRTEAKPKKEKKPTDVVLKLESLGKPICVVLLNTKASKTEDGYQKFLSDKNEIYQSVKNSIQFTKTDDTVHSWLCSKSDAKMFVDEADLLGIPHQTIELPDEALTQPEPFKGIKIKLEEFEDIGKLKLDLNTAWKPVYEALSSKKKEQEAPKQEKKDPKQEKEPTQQEKTPPAEPEEDAPPEDTEDTEPTDDEVDVGDAQKINVGKFRSLKNPYIFILDPRKRYAEYRNFLVPDEEDEVKKASQVLPKAIKLLVSKKLKSQEGSPVVVYFLDGKQANDLKAELKKESRPHFILAEFDKSLFDQDEPFSDLKLGEVAVEQLLVDEMNKVWMEAASQSSGNPVPVVQANTLVPLNFFRLLNKVQRPVEMYIGNQPEGAGSEDTIYVLASEAEAEAFMKLVRKFKMPSNFYERMSANSDIDAEFKNIDPQSFTPANVLILMADGQFKPKQQVEITEVNKELAELAKEDTKEILDKISSLHAQRNKFKHYKKVNPDEVKKLDAEIAKLQEETKITQLAMLHAYARSVLGSRIKKAGTFVKTKITIGTQIVNFNDSMTICFLWGSQVTHPKVTTADVVKQLPFVKSVVTSYL